MEYMDVYHVQCTCISMEIDYPKRRDYHFISQNVWGKTQHRKGENLLLIQFTGKAVV